MQESVLDRQLARLRLAYARSRTQRLLSWWGRELAALLPERVRGWFVERREEVLLRVEGGQLVLLRGRGDEVQELRFDLAHADENLRTDVARELGRSEEAPAIVLCLPAARVLRRSFALPLAAEENLRQVLAFEMDRQTPFRADQVYYDFHVVGRDAAAKQITVDMALVPRSVVEAELVAIDPAGVPLDVVDAAQGNAGRMGFNLLPPEARAPRGDLWLRVSFGLAAVVLVLLGVVMAQSLANREAALEQLRIVADRERTEAQSVAQLRTSLKDAIEGANFLAEKKRSRPPVIDVLLDVTKRLPNDTWLQRFSMNGTQVQLQGQAREASALIGVLQKSPLLEAPALQGAITPDARTSKEQFLIAATATTAPAPAAAAPQPARTGKKSDAAAAKR